MKEVVFNEVGNDNFFETLIRIAGVIRGETPHCKELEGGKIETFFDKQRETQRRKSQYDKW